MMDTAPSTEAVYQGVYTLYNNPDTAEQERASRWLEQLQNSVSTLEASGTKKLFVQHLLMIKSHITILFGNSYKKKT